MISGKRPTEDEYDDETDDETEHGPKICFAQDHAHQLCKRVAERHETQTTKGDAHEEKEEVPPGRFCEYRGRIPGGERSSKVKLGRQCCEGRAKLDPQL